MNTPICGQTNTAPNTSAVNYISLNSAGGAWSATENQVQAPIPIDCALVEIYAKIVNSPGASKHQVFAVRAAGVDLGTVDLTGASGSSSLEGSWTGNAAVTKGQVTTFSSTPSGTPAAPGNIKWYAVFRSNTTGESFVLSSRSPAAGQSAGNTSYYPLQGDTAVSGTETNVMCLCPTGGVFDRLYVVADVAAGSGKNYTVTVYWKSGSTTLSTILANATSNNDSNAGHAITVAGGETITIQVVTDAGSATPRLGFGFRWVPTIDGEALHMMPGNNTLATNTTDYKGTNGSGNPWTATETDMVVPLPACNLKKLYVGADSFTLTSTVAFTVRKTTTGGSAGDTSPALTKTLTGDGSTRQVDSDTTNNPSVSAHELVCMKGVTSVTVVTSARLRASFVVNTQLTTQYSQTCSATQTQTATKIAQTAHASLATIVMVAVVIRQSGKVLLATQAQLSTMARQIGSIKLAIQANLVMMVRQAGVTKSTTQSQSATNIRQTGKNLTGTQANNSVTTATQARVLSGTSTEQAAFIKSVSKSRIVTSTVVGSFQKTVVHSLSTVASLIARLVKIVSTTIRSARPCRAFLDSSITRAVAGVITYILKSGKNLFGRRGGGRA